MTQDSEDVRPIVELSQEELTELIRQANAYDPRTWRDEFSYRVETLSLKIRGLAWRTGKRIEHYGSFFLFWFLFGKPQSDESTGFGFKRRKSD